MSSARRGSSTRVANSVHHERLELGDIESVIAEVDEIAGWDSLDPQRCQPLAQAEDLRLQRADVVAGQRLTPQFLGEAVGRDRTTGVEQQRCQQRSLQVALGCDVDVSVDHVQRTEHSNVEHPTSFDRSDPRRPR